ncbi:SPBc2 prophage-derived uncharacterized protein YonO [Bacillus atrophaeus]|nr:SPBc2 prophage-derived uncharacterized protein YonO [Bacillus atrophaeus]
MYRCEAAKLNEEEDEFKDSELNYQMLQTLTDITDEGLDKLTEKTVKRIQTLYKNKVLTFISLLNSISLILTVSLNTYVSNI